MSRATSTLFSVFEPNSTPASVPGQVIVGAVEKVSDGDGIVVQGIKIRLYGVDAFESRRPGGADAKAFLKGLIQGKKVACTIQGVDVKDDNRPYAICLDEHGKDLSCAVAWRGYAIEWKKFSQGSSLACPVSK